MRKRKLSEAVVQSAIISHLTKLGWRYQNIATKHEKGVDIRLKKSGRKYLIEVKGQGTNKYNKFLSALGQIITRMGTKINTPYKYGIGLPYTSLSIAFRALPWRVAKRLKLYILLVNEKKEVTEYSWKNLRAG